MENNEHDYYNRKTRKEIDFVKFFKFLGKVCGIIYFLYIISELLSR